MTGNRADAQELMQEAFLTLWERWDTIDRIDDPTGYLFRVALNGSRMRARAARRATRRLVAIDPSYDPFDEVDMREDVRRMLRSLTPRQRAALVLLDLYGLRLGGRGRDHADPPLYRASARHPGPSRTPERWRPAWLS